MVAVTAQMVKNLREKTGAGMMDCKKALAASDGDVENAIDWLRTKGLAAAAKKMGRVAAEGVVAVATGNRIGALVEVNAETDFVSRNTDFQGFASIMADMVLEQGDDLDLLKDAPYPGGGRSVAEQLTHNIATIGENMALRRAVRLVVESGVVVPYMHNAVAPGLGRIGVLIALRSDAPVPVLEALGKQLAMHVAATAPQSASIEDLDASVIEREKTVLTEQARASGRPDNIIEKMVQGRMRKFFEEVVLLEQTFVVDNETKVAEVIEKAAREVGSPIELAGFHRFSLGEGIVREDKDFAAEVAAQLGG